MTDDQNALWQSLASLLRSHPWHGITVGEDAPLIVNTYIETVPSDTVKYEIDKKSGYLKVDRPQKYSNIVRPCMALFRKPIAQPRLRSFVVNVQDVIISLGMMTR